MQTTVKPTPLEGLVTIDIDYFQDERGFFIESWHKRDFEAAGLSLEFVQEGHSRSGPRVLRGLHFQDTTAPMGKLLRCTRGAIFDVAVDLRISSPTFGRWFGVELTEDNKTQVYVPPGFAHGFQAIADVVEVQYKQTGFYTPAAEGTLAWNDPELGIEWPLSDPILSKRDQNGSPLSAFRDKPIFP